MHTTNAIRQAFIDYFVGKGHRHVSSSPLVPGNDPSLLFTNSGMVQFKDTFLGAERRDYARAVSSQRCVRAGGKHNDLDSVGYTARHHTFFEMLGNFSFGDYFKREAIHYAWELLTGVYGLPADRLWITVYQSDDEAFDIWAREVGVPVERITRIGDNKGAPFASDNFWQMADTGPCGPCSEIFYDHGPGIPGGPPGTPEEDGDRYIEIWNLVFMQYEKSLAGVSEFPDAAGAEAAYREARAAGKVVQPPVAQRDAGGTLRFLLSEYRMAPLPKPCVDTGMGLERLAAILQGVHSNYEIDLFQALIRAAAGLTATADLENKSLRVIADHIRACSFLIVDGVLPSNEGRGYVLRRIIRRALRHGWMLGVRGGFFHRMVAPLVEQMGQAYPELAAKAAFVERVLAAEEERFADLLDRGMRNLSRRIDDRDAVGRLLDDIAKDGRRSVIPLRESGPTLDIVRQRPDGGRREIGVLLYRGADDVDRIRAAIRANPDSGSFETIVIVNLSAELREDWRDQFLATARTCRCSVQVLDVSDEVLQPYRQLHGRLAFELYDTYGFPIDLTADVLRERGWTVDLDGFEAAMAEQRERARSASSFGGGVQISAEDAQDLPATVFLGYEALEASDCRVLRVLVEGQSRERLHAGDEGVVVLDRTPFYAESGGQVGDHGSLEAEAGRGLVLDTLKLAGVFHGHRLRVDAGSIGVGDLLQARVDGDRRRAIVLNHSATHLLHAALREELGEHVQQKGSLVAPDRLRFDFSHFQPISAEQLARIEARVNEQIRANAEAEVHHMDLQQALDFGAIALFGEKYGDHVRVLRMGDFSTELCGGTHVRRAGDIGLFKILGEGGISAGIRRIEAVTGSAALALVQQQEGRLRELSSLLGASGEQMVDKLQQLFDRLKKEERELAALKAKAANASSGDLLARAQEVCGLRVLAERVEGVDAKLLREMLDRCKQQLGSAVIVLASAQDGKAALVAGVSGQALERIKAGEVLGFVAERAGGRGGGRADMAQGGANDGPALREALQSLPAYVSAKLAPSTA